MVKVKKGLLLGCWNVRSMWGELHELEVIEDFKEKDIKVGVVTEGHWVGYGGHQVEDYFIIYSGHEQTHKQGVGFVLHEDVYWTWRQEGGSWQPISSRIATIRIPMEGTNKFMSVIGVYAPTNVRGNEMETETFYEDLQKVWKEIPKGDMTIIAGDFNARVGIYDPDIGRIIGRYGRDEINSNGEKLREFCIRNNLAIMGTFFPHKHIHSYSWKDAHHNKHLIDHILVPLKWKGCVKDVKGVMHAYHTNADHRLITVRLELSLFRSKKRRRGSRYVSYDRGLIRYKPVWMAYQKEMDKISFDIDKTRPFNDRFEQYRGEMNDKFINITREGRGEKKKSFLSDRSWELVQEKKHKYQLWQKAQERSDIIRDRMKADPHYIDRKQFELRMKQEYTIAANRVKRSVERDKRDMIEAGIHELEMEGGIKAPNLFKKINKLIDRSKSSISVPIKDDNGQVISDEGLKCKQWEKWGQGVFGVDPQVTGKVESFQRPEEWPIDDPLIEKKLCYGAPTIEEIGEMIACLSNNKAADRNNTIAEMLKRLGEGALQQVAAMVREMWIDKVGPESWKVIDIVPIYKKGDEGVCDNYRPISIIDMFSKACGNLLKDRVSDVVEGKLLEAQAGFRENRSCQDMIFTLRLLRGYSKEVRQTIYGCFVDLRKAYDSVDRETLWKVLERYGVKGDLLEMIKLLYRDLRASIRVGEGRTEEFSLLAGVKQGCVLSPLLFNIYLDFVVRQAIQRFDGAGIAVNKGPGECWFDPLEGKRKGMDPLGVLVISALLYADDTALVAASYMDLCRMVHVLDEVTKEWGLTISISKTKIMVWEAPEGEVRPPLVLRGEVVEEVDEFKYLGSTFTSKGEDERDVEIRIKKAWGCFHKWKKKVWRQPGFKLGTKTKVYRMTVIPTLLYGMESWVLTEGEEVKLESTQMRMLRSIMRISLKDHKTNEEIRTMAGVGTISSLIRTARLKWFGKVMRMEEERWPKQVLCGYLKEGKGRGRGRPPLRWTDKVKEDLKMVGLDKESYIPIVMDREKWREVMASIKGKAKAKPQSKQITCGAPCPFVAKNKGGLNLHRKKCHIYNQSIGEVVVEENFPCEKCDRCFKSKAARTTHAKKCRGGGERLKGTGKVRRNTSKSTGKGGGRSVESYIEPYQAGVEGMVRIEVNQVDYCWYRNDNQIIEIIEV